MEATDSGSVEKEQTEEVDNSLESTETVSDENIEEMPEAEMENNMAGFSISGYDLKVQYICPQCREK